MRSSSILSHLLVGLALAVRLFTGGVSLPELAQDREDAELASAVGTLSVLCSDAGHRPAPRPEMPDADGHDASLLLADIAAHAAVPDAGDVIFALLLLGVAGFACRRPQARAPPRRRWSALTPRAPPCRT